MINFFEIVKRRLIVSCQAEGDSPFNSPEGIASFALAAKKGGAAAIRTEGIENTRFLIQKIGLPVIGLIKSNFPDGSVCITGSFQSVEQLLKAGCNVVAIDGTFRMREGFTGPSFIREIKKNFGCMVMADIATFDQAAECAIAGADCVSTTLSGYTPDTQFLVSEYPDFDLIKCLVNYFEPNYPVFAEGRINTPDLASQAIQAGAWAVVVGSAITRPHLITKWFVDAIEK